MSKQTSSVEQQPSTRIKNTELKKNTMTKSELIEKISASQDQLPPKDVELAVRMILDRMTSALAGNQRIEIRGFGSFSLHYRAPRVGRNPKTGRSATHRQICPLFQTRQRTPHPRKR